MHITTLQKVIIQLVNDFPEKGIGYVQKTGIINFYSYRKTYELAARVLHGLILHRVRKDDKLIIALDNNEEIIPVFWACILGGIIPSLMQAPVSFSNHNQALGKIQSAWLVLGKPAVIASKKAIPKHDQVFPEIKWLNFGEVLFDEQAPVAMPGKAHDPAFIQFSSGSTANPKGIVLSNDNILANIHDISVTADIHADTVPVNWMPLYHDMGLVGFHLTPLYAGCSQYLINTVDFVKNPVLWLDVITLLGVDVTASPAFGQALTLRYLERKKNADWDFSTVRNFFNGAEPVSAEIMSRFIGMMGKYGFKETAMIPCYGMAEATLAISMRNKVRPPVVRSFNRKALYLDRNAIEATDDGKIITLVGVGQAMGYNRVRIVDDNDCDLTEGKVGHILVKGRNVTRQFYNPDIHPDDFFRNEWLVTGDMGFFHKGELFITGRTKDLIFVNGQNYYAHDLEQVITDSRNELYGKIAVCAVFDEIAGREKLIVFVAGPQNRKFADKYESIKLLFMQELGLQPDEIIPIKSSEMPRTSSGKLQRYKLTESYQQGVFKDYLKF